MANGVIEGGVYSTSQPMPSSGAELMVENELFDQVFVVQEVKKNARSLKITNGSAQNRKEHSDSPDYYQQRKGSAAELDPENAACTCWGKKAKSYFCSVAAIISLLGVVCLYSLGIVFFYTDVPENKNFDADTTRTELTKLLEICLASSDVNNNGMIQNPDDSTCFAYSDNTCLPVLQSVAMNHGINVTNGSVMVWKNSQAVGDPQVDIIRFNQFASGECQRVGMSFLCQYFYPICYSSNELAITLSEEQCLNIADNVCSGLWSLAQMVSMVPDCSDIDFGFTSFEPSNATSSNTTSSNATSSNITCHPEFDVRCGLCVPNCNRFSEASESRQRTLDIFFIIAAVMCIVGGFLVIIVSFVRRSVMFDFPSVLVIYMTIVMMVISVLVLISYGARDHLYCNQPELPLAYEDPTTFCQFSGFVLHAGVLQIVLYWLLHLIHLFLKFIFPFAIRRIDTKRWKRAFHITEVIVINLVTVATPLYIILDSKYYPYGYPPVLCIPNAELTFYAMVLPLILMLGFGTCIIVLMFWRLQVRTEFVSKSRSKIAKLLRLTTPEVKVVTLLCFFLTFGVVNAVYFSLYARNYKFLQSIATEYAVCQSTGYNESCEALKEEIQDYRYHGLANASYLLMGLLTISNFLFAIHVKQLKGQIRRFSVKATSRFRSTSRSVVQPSKQSRDS